MLDNQRQSCQQEATPMGDRGSRDKAKKEQRKKPKLTIKEKRKLKNEKKNKIPTSGTV